MSMHADEESDDAEHRIIENSIGHSLPKMKHSINCL
jgi:hypothetical protein